MYKKTSEYHYQKISNKGDGKKISIMTDTYKPRIENDYTITTIKTVTSSKNGGECLCGLDHDKLSTNKYSKNYSSYSNILKDKKNLKCTCFECDHIYGSKNNKCTCGLCKDEKYTKISISNEKKTRGRSVETRNLNKYTLKKCICGEDEKNCTCNQNSSIKSNKVTSLIKSYSNIKPTATLSTKICTCGDIRCTCGKDHSSSITKISQTKNLKTILGSKKCTCGKKLCTCSQNQDISKKTYNASNLNIKTITTTTTKKNKDYKPIVNSTGNIRKLKAESKVTKTTTTTTTKKNKDYKPLVNSTANIRKIKEEAKVTKTRVSSEGNYKRPKEEQKCLCGLDHSLIRSTENRYYSSTINQAQCTCGDNYGCTCGLDHGHGHYEEENRRMEDERRRQMDEEERERRRKMDEEERERRRQLDLERKQLEDERRQLDEQKRKRRDDDEEKKKNDRRIKN